MRVRQIAAMFIGASLVAAACSSASEDGVDSVAPTTSEVQVSTSSAPAAGASVTTTVASTVTAPSTPAVTLPDQWEVKEIARGVKPDLAFDEQDRPSVAYLLEDFDGFVAVSAAASGWTEERIAEGYFYGPIGPAYDLGGNPIVAYHDHQDIQFDMELGDLVVATRTANGWTTGAATDDGHDGWDSTVAVAEDGTVHAAGIDPQQFDREDGIQHYQLKGNRWTVTSIGSGPIEYEWNVSLAIKPDGRPALTYFDNNTQDLKYAERLGTTWTIETVVI